MAKRPQPAPAIVPGNEPMSSPAPPRLYCEPAAVPIVRSLAEACGWTVRIVDVKRARRRERGRRKANP